MQLELRNFSSLVQGMAAAVQSSATQLLDLTVGSTLRAVLEANAGVALWMQWLILLVLRSTRAASSTGPDLDTWMADFAITRLAAVPATGTVTLARYTPGLAALVPVGAVVRTADGAQLFSVTQDEGNAAWSAASGGYVLAASAASLDVPVAAQAPGAAGNVQAGSVTLLATAIPGVDTVTNAAAFANGLDAESDNALRARFVNYINSRSRATPVAIGYAIDGIQQGLQYAIQENMDAGGNARMGHFVVTVDDGSGSPAASLLTTVANAIDAVRPVGTSFAVQPPTVTPVAVSLTVAVMPGAQKPAVASAVGAAIASYLNTLPIGAALPLTRIAQIAYGAHEAVANAAQITLNGAAADIAPTVSGVIKAGTVVVD
jgi:uncharacterized phage protein gp47/JayE